MTDQYVLGDIYLEDQDALYQIFPIGYVRQEEENGRKRLPSNNHFEMMINMKLPGFTSFFVV